MKMGNVFISNITTIRSKCYDFIVQIRIYTKIAFYLENQKNKLGGRFYVGNFLYWIW